ncbi:MAG TPA: outer membrane beta-barrel protein [Flavobacteriales bacterium]|nr:outer membrane beta-barrel protein [Flavobacteriales bacterium]
MLHRSLLALLLLLSGMMAMAQGTLRGTVSDPNGETLIGATVVLKSDPGQGVVTDLDGRYSLGIISSAPTVVVFSFIGFETKEVTVTLSNGEVKVQNVTLGEKSVQIKEFEVQAKARRGSDTYLDRMKSNAPAALDFISRDAMLKTGDADAAAAVKRVSGVSTVGAFVTVRGLADRYLVTTINGGRVPTLDPYTNNLRLDLFPTGLMDNIVITKTLTPDLPADWAGAYLSMNTSDYPDRLQVSVATTVGYNPNSTGRTIVSSQASGTDWLGRDDGLRAIPNGVPTRVEDYPLFIDPSLYQQLSVLGLGSYLNGYGITSATPGFNTQGGQMVTTNTQQHLALTQLGLLPPALLYDANAVQAAVNAYNGTYDLAYFSPTFNGGLETLNNSWDNSRWRVGSTTGSPNLNMNLSIGNQIDVFKKRKEPRQLGFLLGLRYSTETQNDEHSTILRTIERFEDENPGDTFNRKGDQRVSVVSSGWNALGNISFKLDRNNSFSLMAMGNVLGQNNARHLVFLDPTVSGETFVSEEQFWEQRRMWVFQYGSKHLIPALNLTVNADVSYTDGDRDVLDFKVVQYIMPAPGESIDNVDGALRPPGRIFRFLNEELLDARLGFERPLGDRENKVRKLKFGGAYRWNQRTNDQNYYQVLGAPGPSQWEDASRFRMGEEGRFVSLYAPFGSFKDNDIGILNVAAAYAMTDYSFTERIRVAGGLRAEHTDLVSDIRDFHEKGVAADDPIRGTVGDLAIGGASAPEPKPAVPGTIEQWDLLPSANLILKLRPIEKQSLNLRLSYFRSLSRPSFREFSVTQLYDYLLQAPVYGNPDLRMTRIDNYDVRLERFFESGDNVSISGFYKYFVDHIELLQTAQGGFTWRNAGSSQVLGMEVGGRKRLLRNLELRGNLTLMNSRSELVTQLDGQEVRYETPMFGQAPYILNGTMSYMADSLKLTVSVSYNVQGPKLAVTNAELDPTGIRAYEMPRHLIDITLNKRFGGHWNVLFRVRDLLNSPQRRTYRFEQGYVGDFDRFAFGTEYLLTLAYTIR